MNKRHKTSNKKRDFYKLKKKLLHRAIKRKHAFKIGIHIKHDGQEKQYLTLIYFGGHQFHLPSSTSECRSLPALGEYTIRKRYQNELEKVQNSKYLLNSYIYLSN